MLSDKIKKLLTLLLVLGITVNLFAAPTNEIKNRFLANAEKALDNGDIETAYKNVNTALKLEAASPSADVVFYAKDIYKRKLDKLIKEFDEMEFVEVQSNLERFPVIMTNDIKTRIRKVEIVKAELEAAKAKAEEEAKIQAEEERMNRQQEAIRAQNEAMQKSMQKNMETTSKAMKEQSEIMSDAMKEQAEAMKKQAEEARQTRENQEQLQQVLTSGLKEMGEAFSTTAEETKRSTKVVALGIIGISLLIVFIILVVIFLVSKGFKQQQQRQEQYMQAFQMIAANQNQTNRLMLGGVTDLYNNQNQMRLAGASTWTPTLSLPEVEFSEEDEVALKELAVKCEDIGQTIDAVSNRKNNSKNVSELVYKISMHLGVPQGMAMLNFCAAMVYDAGFLGLDPELLTSSSLTEDQKNAIKEHVNLAEKHLDFVPKKYWSIFEDAALKHHENMDGSGYPKGLKGDEIPQIARLIRVAETYVSMSSKRAYREALDKETAIQKLREQPQFYDPEVVNALDAIV